MSHLSALQVEISELERLVGALNDVPPHDMTELFYVHAFGELILAAEGVIAAYRGQLSASGLVDPPIAGERRRPDSDKPNAGE